MNTAIPSSVHPQHKPRNLSLLALLFWAGFTPPVQAAELNSADTAWLLTSTGLVLFMTMPGLALLYSGLVRTKNALSVIVQCFAVSSLISVIWIVCGYTLALTDGGANQPWIGGMSRLFLRGLTPDALSGNLPEVVFCMYHLTFAIFAPALMIGSFVERMSLPATLSFTGLWSVLVYVPVCHWLWGGGWLAQLGAIDFAGGIVVHTTAGLAALTTAWYIGPRRGFPRTHMPPHNLPLTAAGAGILAVGWHGFSAGSALMATGAAGMAMLNTHIGASVGSLVWMGLEWRRFGKPTMLGLLTGMIGGLGIISPAAGFVGPTGAFIMGAVGGCVCFFALHWVKRRLIVDDTLDVFPVHGVGGMVGAILTAPFALEFFGGAGIPNGLPVTQQLLLQVVSVLVAAVWSALVSIVVLKCLARFMELRVGSEVEVEGMDVPVHNGKAYHF